MTKRNSKETLLKEIKRLEDKLQKVFDVGIEGISYVGRANYAEREAEARGLLKDAMYGEDISQKHL